MYIRHNAAFTGMRSCEVASDRALTVVIARRLRVVCVSSVWEERELVARTAATARLRHHRTPRASSSTRSASAYHAAALSGRGGAAERGRDGAETGREQGCGPESGRCGGAESRRNSGKCDRERKHSNRNRKTHSSMANQIRDRRSRLAPDRTPRSHAIFLTLRAWPIPAIRLGWRVRETRRRATDRTHCPLGKRIEHAADQRALLPALRAT